MVKIILRLFSQSRAVNWFVSLKTLGSYTLELLKEKLSGESLKFVEQQAGNSVNASIRVGRDSSFLEFADEIKYYEFSSILDQNLCEQCEAIDGETSEDRNDLPDTPYEFCLGGAACRCMIIGVIT